MVAGHGRGGGQVGGGGRSTERGGSSAGEKTEAKKLLSDAARIHGSYRYRNYGVAAAPTFANRESERYRRGRASSPSATSSSSSSVSSSRQRPSTALVVKMEVNAEPEPPRLPQFAPGDFLDDAKLQCRLPQLGHAGFTPSVFVKERDLATVVSLIERSSERDADKAAEWKMSKVFVDLGSDTE